MFLANGQYTKIGWRGAELCPVNGQKPLQSSHVVRAWPKIPPPPAAVVFNAQEKPGLKGKFRVLDPV